MVEPKVALRELRMLGSQFKSSIDSVGKMGEMTNCVTTHQFDRDRAESRAPPADRRTRKTSGAKAMEQTGYQESKMKDLENRSQRNYFEIINNCLGPGKVLELLS